jgi:pimeloyl-ACP methyl ester carboxylesterase
MKGLRWILLAALVFFGTWIAATYPRIGHVVYDDGGRLEARLYGFQLKFADVEGLRMAYYVGGPADAHETVVLLHGFSADKQVWPRFARHLLDSYRVVIPDLGGHGGSDFIPEQSYSGPAQAKRVATLLDQLHIDQVHIAGNSMGGFISAHFALAYPQRTLSLGLFDAAGVKSPKPSELDQMLIAGHNPFIVHSRTEFDSFYAMTMAQPPVLPGFVLAAIAEQYEERQARLQRIFEDSRYHDPLDDKLTSITAPTLVLWGDKDRLIDVSTVDAWCAGLPHSQHVIENGIGHMPMLESPAETAKIYRDFITAIPANKPNAAAT